MVDLASVTNDFDSDGSGDAVNVISGALTLHDDNNLVLGSITSDATTIETDGSITQATGSRVVVAGDTVITTTDNGSTITLSENCLLYTSPSPRDKRQSRMPSSA